MTLKDRKHWSTRSAAAQDEVKDAVEEAVDWLIVHRREAGWTLGAAAVLAVVGGLFLYGRNARRNAAWDRLSQAELLAYSGRPNEAMGLLSNMAQAGGSPTAVGLADLLEGDLNYPQGDYGRALAAYDQAVSDAPEVLKPYALADKVMTLEASGKNADCAAAADSFLEAYADHLLAPQIQASLARCQLAGGQTEAATATLQKLSLQYPGTPWAEWAAYRLNPPKPSAAPARPVKRPRAAKPATKPAK
jgi:tetratricopeptide (TPR) repeat protein